MKNIQKTASLIILVASSAFALPVSIVSTSTGLISFDSGAGGDANLAVSYNGTYLNSEFTSIAPFDITSPGIYNYEITLTGGDINPANPPLSISSLTHFIVMFNSPGGSYSLLTGPISIGSSAFSMHPSFSGFTYDNLSYTLSSLSIAPRSGDSISWFAFAPDGVGDFYGNFSISVASVPEPASYSILAGLACISFTFIGRKRG